MGSVLQMLLRLIRRHMMFLMLGPRTFAQQVHHSDVLRFLIWDAIEVRKRRLLRGIHQDTLSIVVSLFLDRIRSWAIFFASSRMLDLIWLESLRKSWAIRKRLEEQDPAERGQLQLSAGQQMLRLGIDLTRPSWSYIRLMVGRSNRWGWRGILANLAFGSRRQALLSSDLSDRSELEEALLILETGLTPEDETGVLRIRRLLYRLNHLLVTPEKGSADQLKFPRTCQELIRKLIAVLLEFQPRGGYAAELRDWEPLRFDSRRMEYLLLADVLDRIVAIIRARGAERFQQAAWSLWSESVRPSSTLGQARPLITHLNWLPVDHVNQETGEPIDRPVQTVLSELGQIPPDVLDQNPRPRPKVGVTQSLVLLGLEERLRGNAELEQLFHAIVSGEDWESIVRHICRSLPPLSIVLRGQPDRMNAVRRILSDWSTALSFSPWEVGSSAALEIPPGVLEDPSLLQAILNRLTELTSKNKDSWQTLPEWNSLGKTFTDVVGTAYAIVLMEELAQEYSRVVQSLL